MVLKFSTLLLGFTALVWPATYYVSTSGNDYANGTSASTPWAHAPGMTGCIGTCSTTAIYAGDSILLSTGNSWRVQWTLALNGSSGSTITLGTYGSGAAPIISGADQFSNWTTESSTAYYAGASTQPNQAFRDGVRLTLASSKGVMTTGGWWWDSGAHRIYVYDNPAGHTIEASQRAFGITSSCTNSSQITISGITTQMAQDRGMYFCGGTWSLSGGASHNNYHEGIRFDQPNSGSSVTYYSVAYNGRSGIECYNCPGFTVGHSVTHDNVQLTGNQFDAGIKLDPYFNSTNVIVEYNTSYSNGMTSATPYTGAGIWLDTIGSGAIVRYNTAYSNKYDGIDIDADNGVSVYNNLAFSNQGGGITAYADGNTSMTGHVIINNTSYGNTHYQLQLEGPTSGPTMNGCTNNIVKNNILISPAVNTPELSAFYGCENPGMSGSGNVYTYNTMGAPGSTLLFLWGLGNYLTNYSSWETASGNCGSTGCSHSVQSDPAMVNPSGQVFTLNSTSPARGKGTAITGYPYPYGAPDLGAFAYYLNQANPLVF